HRRTTDAETGVGDRRGGRRGETAADQDAARVVADIKQRLLAIVAAHFPTHQCGVERRGLLVVDALIIQVVEPYRLPARRCERRNQRRGVTLLLLLLRLLRESRGGNGGGNGL